MTTRQWRLPLVTDTARPALLLARLITLSVTVVYGFLRFLYDDRSPLYGIAPGDPQLNDLPYATNPTWALFVIVLLLTSTTYVLANTVWNGVRDYVDYRQVGISPTPWSVIVAMTLLSCAGIYYTVVGCLVLTEISLVFWPAFLASIITTLTWYEVRLKDDSLRDDEDV